jgi:hypothetical protein
MMLALTSSRLEVPTLVAKIVSDEPAMPPRLAPLPMNPNPLRLPRVVDDVGVQNWLMTRMPRIRPKK